MKMDYEIRLLKKKDCKQAAILRLAAQEWGFLPAMGLSFQIEILKGTCESRWGFGIVCVGENDKIIGLVYAATDLSRYYRSIFFRRGPMLAFWALLKLVQQPKLLIGLLQHFTYPKKMPFKHIEAEWLTMVVDLKNRNKGIAKELTLSLIDEYKKRGIMKFKSTVATKNIISCRLHEKFGAKLLGNFTLCGDQINVYEINGINGLGKKDTGLSAKAALNLEK